MKFWVVNTKLGRIYRCKRINENEYKIKCVYDLDFCVLFRRCTNIYRYNLIGNGKYSDNIMFDIETKMFDSKKELKNYILLEKL